MEMSVYTQLHDSTKAAVAEPFRGDVWLCSEGLTSHGDEKPPTNPLLVFLLIQGAFTQSYRGIFYYRRAQPAVDQLTTTTALYDKHHLFNTSHHSFYEFRRRKKVKPELKI
jgi:hypothetical protein